MENILTLFPYVGEDIFKNLNNKELVRCREVNKTWKDFIDNNRLIWTRKIYAHTKDSTRHQIDWKIVLNKASLEVLKKLAMALNENDLEEFIRYEQKEKETGERIALSLV